MTVRLNVVEVSSPVAMDALIFPAQHPNTMQYLQNQFSNMSSSIMESGRRFLEAGREVVEQFCDGTMERAAKATLRMVGNYLNPNAIQRLEDLEQIQCAGPVMQRYIMAEPWLREQYHQQLCSGYSETYKDLDPTARGELHYDWRRVNNGMVRFVGEGEDEQWVSTTYCEELREGDRELTFFEQIDVLTTQKIARLFAEQGDDPTSIFGNKIG